MSAKLIPQTVYWWFRCLVRRLLFQTMHDVMLMPDLEQAGREASPMAGVVDTDGRLLMVNPTTADVQDAVGAEEIVKGVPRRWPWLKHLFADGAYDRGRLATLAAYTDFTLKLVRKLPNQKGFQVLPREWVVERSFGWMTRGHRLVRAYEKLIEVSDTMIHLSMGALLLRRVAHPDT